MAFDIFDKIIINPIYMKLDFHIIKKSVWKL